MTRNYKQSRTKEIIKHKRQLAKDYAKSKKEMSDNLTRYMFGLQS